MKLQRTGLIALLALTLGFSTAVSAADTSSHNDASAFSDEATRARLAPIGKVCIKGEECATPASSAPAVAAAPAEPAAAREPKSVYDSHCAMCHGTGVAGAPIFGDKASWAPHIAKGKDTLHNSALHGLNAMPPRGMCTECTDDEVIATADYMVANSGGY